MGPAPGRSWLGRVHLRVNASIGDENAAGEQTAAQNGCGRRRKIWRTCEERTGAAVYDGDLGLGRRAEAPRRTAFSAWSWPDEADRSGLKRNHCGLDWYRRLDRHRRFGGLSLIHI